MKPIWDGQGEADGCVHWTLRSGEIVGLPYVIRRIRQHLNRQWSHLPGAERRARIDATIAGIIANDAWLRFRNGCLVEALCDDAWRFWYSR